VLFIRILSIGLLILFPGSIVLHAATRILRVMPDQTDPAVETVHGPHIAMYDPQSVSRHLLFLFLAGTGNKAASSLNIDSVFAGWGYHAIGLDYENNVLAASCAHSPDSSTFGHYREAIVTGAPVSEKVQVDRANSILNRLPKLLIYLAKNDPNGGWGEFVHKGQPVWSRIIVAGHSQGSGHAAYIGKLFRVKRVLMFSGPQDYMDNVDRPAPWQGRKSATPPSRFFAFLNLKDPFNVHHQIANCMVLMEMSHTDTLLVKPGEAIEGDHHILINDFPTRYHGSTLLPEYENVWRYMARAATR
jgi:hypothetical protein